MASDKNLEYKIRDLRHSTMHVNIKLVKTREYRIRSWIAIRLMILVSWVMKSGIEISTEE